MATDTTTTKPATPIETPDWSRVHRFMVGDRVAVTNGEHDNDGVNLNDEGVITGFGNDAHTYLEVTFDNGEVETLTEDELRHLPPVA